MLISRTLLFGFALVLLPVMAAAQDPDQPVLWDPTTLDQVPVDAEFPPRTVPLTVPRDGYRLNGRLYMADGEGPHATVLLLRDFPGYETDSDIAQALRRAGYNVAMVDYSGAWGSGGTFGWRTAAEDVTAALETLASAPPGLRIDPERIHLVGDGFGAWAAMAGSLPTGAETCLLALGMWNPGMAGRQLMEGGPSAGSIQTVISGAADPASGPIRAEAAELIRSLQAESAALDLFQNSAGIRGKRTIVLATPGMESIPERQTMGAAVAFTTGRAASTERNVLNDDVNFSAGRVRLSRAVVSWFESRCPAW